MRTIRIKLYKFNELSEASQNKAIENLRDINVDYNWSKLSIEDHEERLSEAGFNTPKVMFTGFSSQGDGACFTCERIDFSTFLEGKYKELDITANISHSWRYYFATSTTVNLEAGEEISDDLYNEIEKAIKEERERLGNDIYRSLEKEYEYLTGDEAIKETTLSNDYEFTSDGKLA